MLKAAFVQGMLTKDEFDQRVEQAFASRTYADLALVSSDIPPGLMPATQPRRQPVSTRTRLPVSKVVSCSAGAAITLAILGTGLVTDNGFFVAFFFLPVVTCLGLWVLTGFARLLEAWDDGAAGRRDLPVS